MECLLASLIAEGTSNEFYIYFYIAINQTRLMTFDLKFILCAHL